MKKMYFLTIIALSFMVLYSCGNREIVSETVNIQSSQNTNEALSKSKNDKSNIDTNQIVLFEKEGYKYTLIKCDKDAIDGVIAKIKYENNSDNKDLILELNDYNVNGLTKENVKEDPFDVQYNSNSGEIIYEVNFKYNDFLFNELFYFQLNFEAKVNGRSFPLATITDGSLDDSAWKVVKMDTMLDDKVINIVVTSNNVFCDYDISVDGKNSKVYDMSILYKSKPLIVCDRNNQYGNYNYRIKYFPENKEEVLSILDYNLSLDKDELKSYLGGDRIYSESEKWYNYTKDFINEFDSKIGKYYDVVN